jgi:regulator of sirC expression with transglutaminase-like and TPR domain
VPHGVPLEMSTLTEQELLALLQLLDDRDETTRCLVEERLVALGPSVLEQLRSASGLVTPDEARRLEELAYVLPRRSSMADLATLAQSGGDQMDLEAGLWCLARLRDPQLATAPYTQELERLAEAVRARIGLSRSPYHLLRVFIQVLFEEEGFRGNEDDYYDPDNSFFHKVLERRRGIPITLSALCILLGHRLELPIAGIGLPGHFICCFGHGERALFFDPFNGGHLLTKEGCAALCTQMGFAFSEEYLNPYTSREMLLRMVYNLRAIYIQREALLELSVLDQYIAILSEGWDERERIEEQPDDEASDGAPGEAR